MKNLNLEALTIIQIHITKKKFRDFEPTETGIIATKLNFLAFSIGIREPLQDIELMVLANFLINEFKDFSASEIEIAGDKYAAGKLNFKDSHYQILSKDFLGKLLKSYRIFRNKELVKFHEEKAKIYAEENPTTEEEKKQIHETFLKTVIFDPYEKCIENNTFMSLPDDVAFEMFLNLFKKGLFKPSDEEIQTFRVLACKELAKGQMEAKTKHERKQISNLIHKIKLVIDDKGDKETIQKVKEKAASLYFINWINKQVKLKTNIKEIIK